MKKSLLRGCGGSLWGENGFYFFPRKSNFEINKEYNLCDSFSLGNWVFFNFLSGQLFEEIKICYWGKYIKN